jgi:protein-tyrosine-phosphatase
MKPGGSASADWRREGEMVARAHLREPGLLGLGIGYFAFYLPYCALVRVLANGLLPRLHGAPASGFQLLPAVALGSLAAMPLFVLLSGRWRDARRVSWRGRELPWIGRESLVSAFWTAIIIGTTTLNFTFKGVSILLVLLLMRGGILILSPIVDKLRRREVAWYSWAALAVSLAAVWVALADVDNYRLTWLAALSLAAYLAGYFGRFEIMSRHAKSHDEPRNRRYFIEEHAAATPILVALLALAALVGHGESLVQLRWGFTHLLVTPAALPAFLAGVCYEGLFVFTSLIFLNRREYTYCVPVHCSSSLFAGMAASYVLAALYGIAPPSGAQLLGLALVLVAVLLLASPAWMARRSAAAAAGPVRLFLFVCGGNTCRSPMAAAIARVEAAGRSLEILSAGVSAVPGAPMTDQAGVALRSLGVPAGSHRTTPLTRAMVERAEAIYCMTRGQRQAVLALVPEAAAKTACLDPEGDIPDPIGQPLAAYLACAQRLQVLVRRRLAETAASGVTT